MARRREFDEDLVEEKAMLAFWENGFESTSIGMLEKATGISRISIYNAYGDKRGLFMKALTRYSVSTTQYFNDSEFIDRGLDGIIDMFKAAQDEKEPSAPEHFGCLMLNTILDIQSAGPKAIELVQRTRQEIIEKFTAAMARWIEDGKMRRVSDRVLVDRSEFLVSALWGGRMAVRLHGTITEAAGTARTVIETVESWRAAGKTRAI